MDWVFRAIGRRVVIALILMSLGGVVRLAAFGSHGAFSSTSSAQAGAEAGAGSGNPWSKDYVAPAPGAVPTAISRRAYGYGLDDYERQRERMYERARERERMDDYYREQEYRRQLRNDAAARRAASQSE